MAEATIFFVVKLFHKCSSIVNYRGFPRQQTTEVFLGSKLPRFSMTGFYVTDVEMHNIDKKSTE